MHINALTIAGTDPTGGAGIQADIKTFSALKVYATSVITALLAQNTQGVQSIYAIPPKFISTQLDSVFDDVKIDIAKIGMLLETSIVEIVAKKLKIVNLEFLVLDPVMLSKNGDCLLSIDAISSICELLFPLVSIVTPNLPEAAKLLGRTVAQTEQEILEQGYALLDLGCDAVLMKGGHFNHDDQCNDWLITPQGNECFTAPRIKTTHTHGTGCSLSAALTSLRLYYENWSSTVKAAKSWLYEAIIHADSLNVGKGIGPVHHFYKWW